MYRTTPHAYCHVCGARYTIKEAQTWPRSCGVCKNQTWRNPLPVVVVLIPVEDGLLTVRRGIEPQKGHLALPGGYIDYGESWLEGLSTQKSRWTFEFPGV